MADLAKLANLSKRMKTATPKNVEEARGPSPADDAEEAREETQSSSSQPAAEAAPAPVSQRSAPVSSGGGYSGGGGGPVTVNIDLTPVRNILGDIRDGIKDLTGEIRKIREKGSKVGFDDGAVEMVDQALKHMSASSKANRELAEKMVTSMPEARWYGELQELLRAIGENFVGGGGGGGGGNSAADITSIKEQLEMQKTQLTAIISILQRR
ncbi:MAG: hypothetical protein KBG84_06125 [Planctomycetes bacterium]|nr:hypothetical protein [Planctomycetota bacterium]CAG0983406.1 hypothetical protein PLCT2_02043 [Planctomycetaceae bacterium]